MMGVIGGGSTSDRLRVVLPLLAVVGLSLLVRIYADQAGYHVVRYLDTFYAKELAGMADLPWYRYLLPINELSGRWGPTGFLLVHWIELFISEPGAFYLLTVAMVATGYMLAWLTFQSVQLATLFGIGLATTTFNYHVYSVSGSVIMLPMVTLLMVSTYCQFRWIGQGGAVWAPAMVVACVLFAFSYEGWLDIVPLAWIVYPVLTWQYVRGGERGAAIRSTAALALLTILAVAYVIIKQSFGLGGLHPKGGEADLITTYGDYHLLMAEDLVSSYFTFFYTTLSTYFPPEILSFSLSLWYYGPEKIVALQEGYHPQATHLTLYNHLFLWRYFAGFALAVFLWAYVKVVGAFARRRESHYLILFVLMTTVMVGSPSHLVIKWRPMHAAPLLGYQVYLSVIGWTLLLCYLVDHGARTVGGWRAYALSTLLVCDFAYCAYARPAVLSCMSSEVFLGVYPDPRLTLGGGPVGAKPSPCGTGVGG